MNPWLAYFFGLVTVPTLACGFYVLWALTWGNPFGFLDHWRKK